MLRDHYDSNNVLRWHRGSGSETRVPSRSDLPGQHVIVPVQTADSGVMAVHAAQALLTLNVPQLHGGSRKYSRQLCIQAFGIKTCRTPWILKVNP